MSLRETFLNALGIETPSEVQRVENSVYKSSRDFLRYGNRANPILADWSDVEMSDKDMYKGYLYAVIQKRGNKVASLARKKLITSAKQDVIDAFQKREETVVHPYLKVIENSIGFTEKQFWKNISIYLDLAGVYYLGVVRGKIEPKRAGYPPIITDVTQFIMLNPYEIRRVVDKDGNVAGYIEAKRDGRQREWPLHQIIEMKELNPFEPEKKVWSMTSAAKEAIYTLNKSGDYTRQSLNGNIEAPGIITTDVILGDEDFKNFTDRVRAHRSGEPLFGNGSGALHWESMQVDLDHAALADINEINRSALFAVSGTSKTALGIEQSGTTRETARVQSEQFITDTAQPRLEDIIDFLNLDYKKWYPRESQQTGYYLEVESAVAKDYESESQATALRQSQFELASGLIQQGYTVTSSYQYAQGKIGLEDLELKKGLEEPTPPDSQGGNGVGNDDNSPNPQDKPSQGGSGEEDDSPTGPNNPRTPDEEIEAPERNLNGGKGSGNHGHKGRPGKRGGSGNGIGVSVKELTSGFSDFNSKVLDEIESQEKDILGDGFDKTKKAIDSYMEIKALGGTSEKMNEALRSNGGDLTKVKGAQEIQDACNIELDSDLVVHRGESYDGATPYDGFIGMTSGWWREDAFTSTTTQEDTTNFFNQDGTPVKIKATIKKGVKVCIPKVYNRNYNEGEVLLPVKVAVRMKKVSRQNWTNPETGEDKPTIFVELEYFNKDEQKNDLNGLVPHSDLVENGNPYHEPAGSDKGSQLAGKEGGAHYEDEFGKSKENNSACSHQENVVCPDCENSLEDLMKENDILEEEYNRFLAEVRGIEKELVEKASKKVTVNAFEEDDLIGPRQKKSLIGKMKNLLSEYWGKLFVLFGNKVMGERNEQFNTNEVFKIDNDIENKILDNADRVAEGHIETITKDVLEASNQAYTEVVEDVSADLIIEAYRVNPEKFKQYFPEEPTMADALESIRKTDILEVNKKIYEKANKMAFEGYKRGDIVKAIREKYPDISEKRAKLIASNETSRAFSRSQYEADLQFLKNTGNLQNAYKRLVSMRPDSEKDKICPFCASIIEKTKNSPIPFTQPFLKFGDSIEVVENGVVKNFTANYENIDSGVCHVNCFCRYELIILNETGDFDNAYRCEIPSLCDSNKHLLGDSNNDNVKQGKVENGGKGSGNFGHSGRPGKVGGSGKGFELTRLTTTEWAEKMKKGELHGFLSLLDDTNSDYVVVPLLEKMDVINEGKEISEEVTKKNLDKMTPEEKEALSYYTSEYNAGSSGEINHYLRTGEGNESAKKGAELVTSALNKCSLGEDTVCYRGVDPKVLGSEAEKLGKQIQSAVKNGGSRQFKSMEKRLASLRGMEIQDKGCLSTSKFYDSKYSNLGMTMVIRAKKNDKACDIHSLSRYGQSQGQKVDQFSIMFGYSPIETENEVLFAPNTKLKVTDAKLTDKGILVECETVSEKKKNSLSGVELNGGKGSGNHGYSGRPGKVGGSGKGKNPDTSMKSMTYTEQGENGPQLIKETLAYLRKNHPEIYNEEVIDYVGRYYWDKDGEFKVDKEKFLSGETTIWNEPYEEGDRYLSDLAELFRENYYKDSKGNDRDKNGEGLKDFGSKLLYGILVYTKYGAKSYGKEIGGRKEFDERFGISDFIDKNKDVHYASDRPLYRGLTTNKTRAKALKIGVEVDMEGVSSWTENEEVSQRFLDTSLAKNGTVKVIFRDVTKGERNAMINPFSSTNSTSFTYNNQSEVIYSGSSKFKIKNVKPETLGRIGGDEIVYYVDVESK